MDKKERITTMMLGKSFSAEDILAAFPDATEGAVLVYRSAGGAWVAEKLSIEDLTGVAASINNQRVLFKDSDGTIKGKKLTEVIDSYFGTDVGCMLYRYGGAVGWTALAISAEAGALLYTKTSAFGRVPAWLAAGSSGQVLMMVGGLPKWIDVILEISSPHSHELQQTVGAVLGGTGGGLHTIGCTMTTEVA